MSLTSRQQIFLKVLMSFALLAVSGFALAFFELGGKAGKFIFFAGWLGGLITLITYFLLGLSNSHGDVVKDDPRWGQKSTKIKEP